MPRFNKYLRAQVRAATEEAQGAATSEAPKAPPASRPVFKGERGGNYYIADSGKRVYVAQGSKRQTAGVLNLLHASGAAEVPPSQPRE